MNEVRRVLLPGEKTHQNVFTGVISLQHFSNIIDVWTLLKSLLEHKQEWRYNLFRTSYLILSVS